MFMLYEKSMRAAGPTPLAQAEVREACHLFYYTLFRSIIQGGLLPLELFGIEFFASLV